MGRVIALANQKGGVGKTTTAINLGASLAVAERRTLVVDMDPQANATSGLGCAPDTVDGSVYDVLVGKSELAQVIRPIEGLDFLELAPSVRGLGGAQIELVDMPARESILRRALTGVIDDYDYILIDPPPSLGLLTINTLVAADEVLVPLQCEYYALEGLSELLGTIDRLRETYNERQIGRAHV